MIRNSFYLGTRRSKESNLPSKLVNMMEVGDVVGPAEAHEKIVGRKMKSLNI